MAKSARGDHSVASPQFIRYLQRGFRFAFLLNSAAPTLQISSWLHRALHDVIARTEHFLFGAIAHQVQGLGELIAGGVADLNQAVGGIVGEADAVAKGHEAVG